MPRAALATHEPACTGTGATIPGDITIDSPQSTGQRGQDGMEDA